MNLIKSLCLLIGICITIFLLILVESITLNELGNFICNMTGEKQHVSWLHFDCEPHE